MYTVGEKRLIQRKLVLSALPLIFQTKPAIKERSTAAKLECARVIIYKHIFPWFLAKNR